MSAIIVVSLVILAIAVLLIEQRAIRTGDERRRTAPGFVLITCGVFLLAIGVAAAIAGDELVSIAASVAGLMAVVLGATRRQAVAAH